MRLKIYLIAYLFLLITFSIPTRSSGQEISNQSIESIVAEVTDLLKENYVFPEVGKKYANQLSELHKQGVFSDISVTEEFVQKLTDELQKIHPDRHLRILSPSMTQARFRPVGSVSREEMMARRLEMQRRQNFFFNKVEVLPGNIGYFRMNQFPAPGPAASRVDAIMEFLKDTEAMIIDLRSNPGGGEGVNQYISSYFFDEGQDDILYTRYYRPGDSTLTVRVLPDLPAPRKPDMELYILVGPYTGSSAENIAYSLQSIGRATIVGEPTAGAAHSSRIYPLSDDFSMQLPIARVSNPYTNENWEGEGVIPDIQTDFENAHLIVQKMLLEAKLAESSNSNERRFIEEALSDIKNELEPKEARSNMASKELMEFEGTYDTERHVWVDEDGYLMYKRDGGIDLRMEKIEEDLYKLTLTNPNMRLANELPNVRFDRNPSNAIKGITLVFEDGRIAGQYEKTK